MEFYIHKDLTGLKDHLLCQPEDGSVKFVHDVPGRPLFFGEEEIIEVAKVYGLTLPSFPPRNYVKAARTVLGNSDVSQVPWKLMVPRKAYIESIHTLGKDLVEVFKGIDFEYYQRYYKRTLPLLGKMRRCKIDPIAYKHHTMNEEKSPHLESFHPKEDGYTNELVYSKCDTVTGRLKVISGPNILHLFKSERNVIASRFGSEGRVWTLDFKSLEPRTILGINNSSSGSLFGNPPQDIYSHVLKELKLTDISRDAVKQVVITQLYGAGYDTILEKLTGVPNPQDFIAAVNDWFGVDALREKLLQEYELTNREFIKSFYGRRVNTTQAKPYMLINRFIQSTAVDIALMGFDSIVRHVESQGLMDFIVPVFILHDALFLDVHKDYESALTELSDVGSKNIPLFPGFQFPIKPEQLI